MNQISMSTMLKLYKGLSASLQIAQGVDKKFQKETANSIIDVPIFCLKFNLNIYTSLFRIK